MKTLLLVIAILTILYLSFGWIGASNQKAFEMCMEDGKQSEDTCRFYAFQ